MVCGRNDMHAEVLKSTSPLENQSDVLGAKIYFLVYSKTIRILGKVTQ